MESSQLEPDRKSRIEAADLPGDLRKLLLEFVAAAEAFIPLPHHHPGRQFFFNGVIDQILDEVFHPEVDEHWWETELFFLNRSAGETQEPAAKAFQAVGMRLVPALRAHLGPYDQVTLREITAKTMRNICRLSDTLSEPRKWFVGQNVYSLAEALFNPKAWYRAIYAGRAPVGFLTVNADDPKEGDYYCTRFMLAEPFHWRDYGRPAVELMVEHVRRQPGAKKLWGSAGEGEGSPKNFWRQCGFEPTGEVADGEVVMQRPLDRAPVRAVEASKSSLYGGGDTKTKIRGLIMSECLPGESPDKLRDDTPLREILDSMSELKLVNLIETDTGLRVDARELSLNLTTLDTLMSFISRQTQRI